MTSDTVGTPGAVGVGVGPFNLSLAALLAPTGFNACFFERSADFQWHPGLLLPEATLQVSYLKDLVTLVDPTSQYSFVAFLGAHKRLYRFINRTESRVSRLEFNQYLQWVAKRLPNVEFGAEVREVRLDADGFAVQVDDRTMQTRNLVLGTGLVPNIQTWSRPYIGNEVFHSNDFLRHPIDATGRVIAVVGGGQSGAEVVWHLLLDIAHLPSQLVWISHRANFLPLDESPFTNELFNPAYSDYFFSLTPEQRDILLSEQRLASLRDRWGASRTADADVIVLGTGYHYELPEALQPLAGRLTWDQEGFPVRADFSVEWDGPPELRIYAQDAARHMRGVADPNLSLMAWRSAIIANSLLGRQVYDVSSESSVFDFDVTR